MNNLPKLEAFLSVKSRITIEDINDQVKTNSSAIFFIVSWSFDFYNALIDKLEIDVIALNLSNQ